MSAERELLQRLVDAYDNTAWLMFGLDFANLHEAFNDANALLAQPERKPQWSDQPPTVPGRYWQRQGNGCPASLCYVGEHTSENFLRVHWNSGLLQSIKDVSGQWAGPLTPPEE